MQPANHSIASRTRSAMPALAWLALALSGTAIAASTEISNAPLFTSSATAVKPNIMFILDDSGSMKSDFLPDEAGKFDIGKYGRRAAQCNGVAYNPDIVYTLPVDYTGASKPAGDVAAITANPATQTTAQRALGAAIATLPAVGSTITVAPQGNNPRSSWYDTNDVVTIFQDASNYMVGVVTSWDRSTRTLKVRITSLSTLAGTMLTPTIGDGQPTNPVYYKYTGTFPKLGYTYNSSGNVDTTTDFYKQCASNIGSTPGSSVFTAVTVTAASAEAQNYANWYKYYRTRMDMMKSSVSLAFKGLDNRYRLGYSTISEETITEGSNFLDIREVDATQKQKFYTAVDAAQPISWTPLRAALAKAGQYYAKKANGQTYDPVQYSCQRNFTILSTDGYWNTNDETTSSPKYGPYQLDRTTPVGQQDGGSTKRPMYDGGAITDTTTEKWTVTVVTTGTEATPTTTTTTAVVTTGTITAGASAESRTNQRLVTSLSVPAGNFSRSGNVVTVSTGTTLHDLVSGDVITVTGGNSASSSLRATDVIITRISDTAFSYVDVGSNMTGSGGTNFTVTPAVAASCSGGEGVRRNFLELKNASFETATTQTTTVQTSTSTVVITQTDRTPYTRTLKVQNGTTVLDETVAGAVVGSTQRGTASVSTGTSSSSSTTLSSTPATAIGGTFRSTGVALSTGTSCRDSASGAGSASSISGTQTLNGGTVSTSSTSAAGAVVLTTTGTTTTESAHTSSTTQSTVGGSSNSLADVAMYYYQTDLRTSALSNCTGALGSDVCENNVPGEDADAAHSFGDNAPWQHMTTFTLGLGVSGLMTYDANYQSLQSGSFYDILSNGANWPVPGDSQTAENIDDLWHAAVNGRGQYFSAGDPGTLTRSLNSALDSIKQITGAASAASTSSLQPVEGDNDIYVAQFTTAKWYGDVLSFKIDPETGLISRTSTWSARSQLETLTPASRKIYYKRPGSTPELRTFTYSNLSTDGYAGLFDGFCTKPGANGGLTPEQCSTLSSGNVTNASTGTNLVNFLRGDKSMAYYRTRDNLLGDIINASPLFVGKPAFRYTENDYATFASTKAGRQAVVLAAANDGMLHAFDRANGNELWAYIPSFVMPNLYKLADTSYSNNHSFFVDGSPQVGDIFVDDGDGTGAKWKTIVVGGLNAGGRGYYALDLTDPAVPKVMWEFKHDDLGLTFGNPIITKRTDGMWVVVFASGYNNVSPGDGNGHLFVVNANTGALVKKVSTFTSGTTPAGDTTTPSGLARINTWVDSETVNTSKRFYGGDLLGNLWRFDIDDIVEPHGKALLLAQLTSTDGTPQPVTVRPALAEVSYNGVRYPVVFVPTGRYLGTSDLADTKKQSIYAIKDPLIDASHGVVRSNPRFVTQTITASGNTRTSTNHQVDWSSKDGWRADLPVGGERVSVNPQLALDTLFIGTNIPANDACTVGGNSFLYKFNIVNGSSVATYIGNVLIQGLTVVQLTTGGAAGSLDAILTRSDGSLQTDITATPPTGGPLKRTSWRELVD